MNAVIKIVLGVILIWTICAIVLFGYMFAVEHECKVLEMQTTTVDPLVVEMCGE